jgi:hypothetical protein
MDENLPEDIGPVVAELAGRPLDDDDLRALQEVAGMYDAVDPVPDDLVSRVQFALALDEVFDEVARMTRVPLDAMAVRSEHAAGTRTETVTFSAERLTAMVTSTRVGADSIRLDGWLAPPEAMTVRLRMQHGPVRDVVADAAGRFSFDDLPAGFAQLSFHPDGEAAENAVVTPLFQL